MRGEVIGTVLPDRREMVASRTVANSGQVAAR